MKLKISQYPCRIFLLTILCACTDLEPELTSFLTGEEYLTEAEAALRADPEKAGSFIGAIYTPLYRVIGERNLYALTEAPTDEMVTPTRGTDWSDNGIWIALHQHDWSPDHLVVRNGWNDLSAGISRTYEVLINLDVMSGGDADFRADLEPYIAEARALRAYYMWQMVDLFGQVLALDQHNEPMVLNRKEGTDFIISELEEIIPQMFSKDEVEYGRAVKQTAEAILAKVYLNRFIYDPTTTVDADMDKVIQYTDAVINSGLYALADDYFELFDQDNENSSETLLVLQNSQDRLRGFNSQTRILMTLHYSQKGGGAVPLEPWNGMATTEDFYYSWDSDNNESNGVQTNDTRFYDDRYLDMTGIPLGFLEGQQVGPTGNPLTDRKGNPLVFTPEIGDITKATEAEGVRVIKWFPDMDTQVQVWGDNDIALLRYADVILMKAEALWRKGNDGDALSLINQLRTKRGASTISSISGNGQEILDERGYELYWEGHRRTDLIRFGQFTKGTWWAKGVTEDYKSIYPIPSNALTANNNLVQNPGYGQ